MQCRSLTTVSSLTFRVRNCGAVIHSLYGWCLMHCERFRDYLGKQRNGFCDSVPQTCTTQTSITELDTVRGPRAGSESLTPAVVSGRSISCVAGGVFPVRDSGGTGSDPAPQRPHRGPSISRVTTAEGPWLRPAMVFTGGREPKQAGYSVIL